MLTNWHFKYLMLGNLWCLVHARKDQVTQLNMTVACSEDTVLLCIVNGDQGFSCLCNMTWSNAVEEACGDGKHVNKNREEDINLLMDVRCDLRFSNCTVTGSGNYTCSVWEPFGTHRNSTAIFQVSGFSKQKTDVERINHTPEIVFSVIVLLSVVIMFLSYRCLQKTYSNIKDTPTYIAPLFAAQKPKILLDFSALQPENTECV